MSSSIFKKTIIFYMIYYSIFTGVAIGSREKIILAADYWCPYNCKPDDKNPGYLVELAQKAFEINGIDIEYKLMPWSEALLAVQEGKINGIIGLGGEADDLLTSKIPQAYSFVSTFTTKDTDWVYDDLQSLNDKKITLSLDYHLEDSIRQYVSLNYPLNPELFILENSEYSIGNAINNLLEKKADIYIEDEKVVYHYIISNNLSSYIRNAGKVDDKPLPVFIAFSNKLKTSETYVKMLEDAMYSLDATGDLHHLQKKYEVSIP